VNFKKEIKFNFRNVVSALTICFVISLALFGGGVFAQVDTGLETTARGAGLDGGETDLVKIIANIVSLVLGFLGVIFLILVIYGGFMRMTAAGDADKVGKSMKIIINAAIGVAIVLASYAITSFVFSNIEKVTEERNVPIVNTNRSTGNSFHDVDNTDPLRDNPENAKGQ